MEKIGHGTIKKKRLANEEKKVFSQKKKDL